LVYILENDPDIRIIGTACSGESALEFLGRHNPDAVLMDIHLPGIDGFETTRRIMATNPIPVVVCTASTHFAQIHTAMQALEAGALAVMKKPRGLGDPAAEAEAAELVNTLKLMSEVKVVRRWRREVASATEVNPFVAKPLSAHGDFAVVAIGASTGGPPVISQILADLPKPFPVPILVVQHISTGFTAGFAQWLGTVSGLPVHVAQDGETPLPGHVYIAPDDQHLRVGPAGALRTARDPLHHGLRPSVGVLFRSVAECFGHRAIGVLLTGMGQDGAEELKLMADKGALTVAQDEASCVVFGMPGEAIRMGAVRFVFPPEKIAQFLATSVRPGLKKGETDG